MKITDVKAYDLRYPLEVPFANSQGWSRARTAGVVEITTDAGITGWGEGLRAADRSVRDRLIGRDPTTTDVIWQGLSRGDIGAMSGVDIALWDIAGKALDLPIHRLLGGAFRERIPAYASGLFMKDVPDATRALEDEAKGYVDQGFPAVKMKIGFGRDYDTTNVSAIRRAIGPSIGFAVDANCGYDVATAIDVGQRIVEHDLLWYEEPVPTDDVNGYVEIRRALKIAVAGGESLQGLIAFRDLIQGRGLDIVQPDVSVAGGFSECRKVAALADANHVRVVPHMWGTAIRLAATLHWQATIPDAPDMLTPVPPPFEFDMTENRLRTDLAREPIRSEDGYVPVPKAPGLGIEIDREVLERCAV